MDIHCAGKIRCPVVILPIVICKPRVFIGHSNEIAGSLVVNAVFTFAIPVQHGLHAGGLLEQLSHFITKRRFLIRAQVHVGYLMVGHGKGAAGAGIE